MRAYCGEKARDIPIVYTLPQEKVTQQGAIYIGLREGKETNASVGSVEDTYLFKEMGAIKETSQIQSDNGERLYFEVDHNIGDLINVENLAFAASDNVHVEDNKVFFRYDPELVGMEFNVNYIATYPKEDEGGVVREEEKGLKKGFTADEAYSVLAISTNMDTVRCIDLILKAILIMMRENPQEKNSHLLQHLQFGQIEEIDTGRKAGDGGPELIYGRETIVSYKVSYSLDVPLLDKINEIIVNHITKEEG